MKYMIVGTAGHIDHGKTAIIRCLTGTDTDRLIEEKKRGISIDIGFAALKIGETLSLGIVDVPGHERFLKNMLAGTGSVDMAMLVIAADEGIMPQTREHFEMLQCFGIRNGIVVLNKIDKVEADWLFLIEEEVRKFLEGSFLEKAPICKVSAITGAGIEMLKMALQRQAEEVTERDRQAPFRLWIDRAFLKKGQGVIITGSVLSGEITTGDSAILFPGEMKVKVREIESHNQSVAVVGAGQRAALKLAGCSLDEVGRGMCLSAENYGVSSNVWEAVILWKKVFPSGTRIRLHMGTGEFIGRISYKKNNGESTSIARLHLESLVSGGLGDQGIVRRYSPQDLIGGVIFLKPAIGNHKLDDGLERLSAALLHRNQKEVMYELLRMSSVPPGWIEWRRLAGYTNTISVHAAVDSLIAEEKVRQAGNYYMTNGQFLAFQSRMRQELAENHRQKPDEPGISKETLRKRINLPENISDWFFQKGVHSGLINIRDEYVADKFHAEVHGQSMAQLQEVFERNMDVTELIEVTPQWLSEKLSCSPEEIKPFFETLVRQKILVRIAGVHVYRKTIQYIGSIIQKHFASHSTLSAGEFRDLMKTSRRLAIPVLEYLDSNNYTIRQNEGRRPGPKLKNLSE